MTKVTQGRRESEERRGDEERESERDSDSCDARHLLPLLLSRSTVIRFTSLQALYFADQHLHGSRATEVVAALQVTSCRWRARGEAAEGITAGVSRSAGLRTQNYSERSLRWCNFVLQKRESRDWQPRDWQVHLLSACHCSPAAAAAAVAVMALPPLGRRVQSAKRMDEEADPWVAKTEEGVGEEVEEEDGKRVKEELLEEREEGEEEALVDPTLRLDMRLLTPDSELVS